MPLKKKTTITQTVTGEPRPVSFISQMVSELPKAFVTSAIGACLVLVGMYFAVQSLSNRVFALESETVRKDVLLETLTPMKADIAEIRSDIKELLRK